MRSVALGFFVGTGSATEDEPSPGWSHLLEHMLFRGTESYGSLEIDQIFDAMGAELNAGTGKDSTSVYSRVLDVHLERAFDVLADMVWRPLIAEDELGAEREIVIEEIAMYEDDPQDLVFDVLGGAVFGDHPLGRPVIGIARDGRRGDGRRAAGIPRRALRARRPRRRGRRLGRATTQLVELVAARAGARRARRRARAAAARAAGRPRRRRAASSQRDTEQYHLTLGAPRLRARRRAPLRAARARHDPRRHVVLAALPGGARAARPRLQRLQLHEPARAHRPGRHLRRHAAGQRRQGAVRRRRGARAAARRTASASDELELAKDHAKGRIVLSLESTSAAHVAARLGDARRACRC